MFSERDRGMVDDLVLRRLYDGQLTQLRSGPTAGHRPMDFQTINTRTRRILRRRPMELGQCEADRGDGRPCGEVTIWHPMCPAHQDTVMGIRPGPSGIPGVGQGLFSTRAFARNQAIAPYIGETLYAKPVGVRIAYAIELNTRPRTWPDAAVKLGMVALANHAGHSKANGKFVQLCMGTEKIQRLLERHPGVTEVTLRHPREGPIKVPRALLHHLAGSSQWLVAKKDIPAGAEIFVSYGAEAPHTFDRDLEHRVVVMR